MIFMGSSAVRLTLHLVERAGNFALKWTNFCKTSISRFTYHLKQERHFWFAEMARYSLDRISLLPWKTNVFSTTWRPFFLSGPLMPFNPSLVQRTTVQIQPTVFLSLSLFLTRFSRVGPAQFVDSDRRHFLIGWGWGNISSRRGV